MATKNEHDGRVGYWMEVVTRARMESGGPVGCRTEKATATRME